MIGRQCANRLSHRVTTRRGDLRCASAVWSHPGQQIGSDRDVTGFGKFIRQLLHPISHAEDLVNDHDRSGLLVYFGIDNEAVDLAIAVLNLHPFVMARRFRELLFGPILNSFAICINRRIRVMVSAHVLSCDASAKIEQCDYPENDHREKPFELEVFLLHMPLRES